MPVYLVQEQGGGTLYYARYALLYYGEEVQHWRAKSHQKALDHFRSSSEVEDVLFV